MSTTSSVNRFKGRAGNPWIRWRAIARARANGGRIAVCWIALMVLVLTAGCSTTYQRTWKRADPGHPASVSGSNEVQAPGLEGRWSGRWLSHHNGHTGKLRCIVSHRDGDLYDFHYWATFWKVFSASYRAPLAVNPTADGYQFSGSKDLGALAGGVYHYEGTVVEGRFQATYRSDVDRGIFEMDRVD